MTSDQSQSPSAASDTATTENKTPASTLSNIQAAVASASSDSGMHVKVYSPFSVYFDEDALSISGVNATGPFDILPKHHNFLSLLSPCELIVRTKQAERRIRIAKGVMHVKADQVVVFLDV